MKKHLLYLISVLLFLAISFSAFSQLNVGGKIDSKTAKTLKEMGKALKKGDFKSYSLLKAGAGGTTQCLVPYVCANSAVIPLIANVAPDAWPAYKNITWEALKVTGLDGLGNIVGVPFAPGNNIVTYDPITKWNFHPENVPVLENGQFVEIIARLYNNLGINFASFSDVVMYYRTPQIFNISSVDGSVCSGLPYTISLASSTAPVGPNIIIVSLMTNTEYVLKKDGISTGDTLIGTGSQLDYSVTQAGVYTVEAINIPDPMFGSGDVCSVPMSGSTTVSINTLPVVTATLVKNPICTIKENLDFTGGPALLTSYSWTGPGIVGVNTNQNFSINTAPTSASGLYTLVGVDNKGCVNSASVAAQVNPLPIVTLTGNQVPCMNSVLGDDYSTASGKSNYVWSIPAGATVTTALPLTNKDKINIIWTTVGPKTISVNYDDINTCSAVAATSLLVNVNPLPTITSPTPNKSCLNTPIVYTTEAGMSSYNWNIVSGTGTISNGTTNQATVSWTSGIIGSIGVTYVNLSGCSTTSLPYSVTINPLPTATASNNGPICEGGNAALTGGVNGLSTYSWAGPGSFTPNSTTQSPSINNILLANAGNYTLTVTDINGCQNSAITNVVVNAIPTPTITPLPVGAVCQGVTVKYTTEGAPNTNWDWTVVGGTITAGGDGFATVDVLWNSAAAPIKTVSVNYKNAAGCLAAIPPVTNVIVNALPTPTITSGPVSACLNSTTNVYTTQPGFGATYVWSFPSGGATITSGINTNSITVTWTSTGAKIVKVQYDNASGCTGISADYGVTVNALPTATASNNGPVCEGGTIALTGGVNGLSSYSWAGPGAFTPNATTQSPTITNILLANAGNYTLTVTDINGCQKSAITNVVVNAQPNPTITPLPVGAVCQGVTVKYTTEGAPNTNWDWTVVGGTITAGGDGFTTVDVLWNNAAAPIKTVSVNYKNAAGCLAVTAPVTNVIVNALPTPTITSGPVSACLNSTTNVYTTQPGFGATYVWSFPSGGATITSGINTNSITVTWTSTGAKIVKVQYDNASGCTGISADYGVTVNALPTATASNNGPVCEGGTIALTGGVNGLSSYSWAGPGSFTPNATTQSPTITNILLANAGNYTLTVTDINGCQKSAITNVVVNAQPTPTITPLPVGAVCQGGTVKYTTEGAPNTNWDWTVVGGTITAGGDGFTTVDVLWNNAAAPIKTVSVNYKNAAGCLAVTAPVTNVTVNALPTPTITSGPVSACLNSTTNVYTTQPGFGATYVWSFPSGGATITSGINTNSITVTWTSTGAKIVKVQYDNASGCTGISADYGVTVNALPTATASNNGPVCEGGTIALTGGVNGLSSYSWAGPGSFTPNATTQSPTITNILLANGGNYTLTVTDINGCQNSAITNVVVNAQPTPTITSLPVGAVCQGVTVKYTTEGAPNTNWDWTVVGGTITAGGDGFTTVDVLWNNAAAPIKTVSVNYKNAAGCLAVTAPVTNAIVNALPTPTITSGPVSACLNSTTNVYTTQPGFGATYVWSFPSGGATITSGINTNSITVTWTSTGAKIVKVQYDSGAGCTGISADYAVTVNPLPVPSLNPSAPVCAGTTQTYTSDLGMGVGKYTWTVTGGSFVGGISDTESVQVKWDESVATIAQTLTVNYVNLNGCTAPSATSKLITVNGQPTVTLTPSPNTPICQGDIRTYNTELGMSLYNWNLSNGTITGGGGATDAFITIHWNIVTAAAKKVSVNYSNPSLCAATLPFEIVETINALPVPTIAGPSLACIGVAGNVYTTQSGSGENSYLWTIVGGAANGTINSGQGTDQVSVTWASTGVKNINVKYKNISGCVGTSVDYPVTVNLLPVPSIIGNATACEGIVSSYSTEVGMVPGSYVWTVSAAGTIQSGQGTDNISVLWNSPGPLETVSVTYSNGCAAAVPFVKTINVGAKPTPTITSLPGAVCIGASKNYQTEVGRAPYTWTVVGGTITTLAPLTNKDNIDVTWNAGAIHTVSVNYTAANGCTAPTPTIVNEVVLVTPSPTITGSSNECIGATGITYTSESGAGENGWTWAVSAGGQILSGLGTSQITVQWNNSGAQSVSVNYKNAGGCFAPAATIKPVTINAIPIPTVTGAATACIGSTKTYTTEALMAGYVWSVSANGTIVSGAGTNSIQVTWNNVGAETVFVNYSDGIGCSPALPSSYGVNVVALPTITLTGPSNVCTSSSDTYSAPAGNNNYIWNVAGGVVSAGGSLVDNFVTVTWPATIGVGSVSLNYSSAAGCIGAAATVKNISIGTTSTPSVTGLNLVCQGATGVAYSTESGMNAGSYVWTVSAGGVIKTGAGTDAITVDWTLGTGAQTVSVNYTNPSGCPVVGPFVYPVTVSALPITEIIAGPASSCLNGTDTYSIPAGHSNIVWSVSANGLINGANNGNSVQIDWTGLGAGTVFVSYTNVDGCSPLALPSKSITVNALPIPTISSTSASVCVGSIGDTYTTEGGMSGYTWNVTGGSITSGASSNIITVDWTVAGAGTVTVNYNNVNNCTAAAPALFNVTVKPLPTPVIAGNNTVCINTVLGDNYTTNSGGTIANWFWTVTGGTILSGQNTDQISVKWTTNVNTFLTVSYDENGCTGTSAPYNVTVNPLPVTQTAVTSPADGFYCSGAAGVDVILTGSEPTVSYELYDASLVLIGVVPAGTVPVRWTNVTAGTYSVKGISATSCTSTVASNILVQAHALPTQYTIDPTGTVVGCNAGAGYTVSLNGVVSEAGVSYQLLLNGAATGLPVLSAGGPISFGPQFAFGTYTILGTNSITGCTQIMTNSFVMDPDIATTTFNVISNPVSGQFCTIAGGGVVISLTPSSDLGVSYVLEMGGSVIETVVGTGSSIDFAKVTTPGVYRVQVLTPSGCKALMNGSVIVDPLAPPLAYPVTVDNGGYYCNGDLGVAIHISGQQKDVVYNLYEAANPLVVVATQTGFIDDPATELSFAGVFSAGLYNVTASKPLVAACSVPMLNTVTVTENTAITVFNVSTTGDFCTGATTDLILSDTQVGAEYRWVTGTSSSVWTASPVGGGSLSFVISTADSYTVEARIISNGITCLKNMSGTAVIGEKPLPSDVSLVSTGGADCHDGIVITITSSQFGVIYSAIDQGSGTTPIASVVGTGSDISFTPITDNGKTYYVEANLNGCTKTVGTPITINIPGVVVKQVVNGGGSFCTGGSATIGLGDTEVGVQYDLFKADIVGGGSSAPAIASLVGDGFAKSFSALVNVSGEYFVVGTAGTCANEMTNRVDVSLNPAIVADMTVLPNGSICEGTTAVFTGTGGDKYTFYLNLVSQGVAVGNTFSSATLKNGDQVKVLVENTSTGCSALTLPITITVENKIKAFNLLSVSNGLICPSSTDTLYLENSEIGVNYTLLDGANAPVGTVAGTNGVVFFSSIVPGTYSVIANRALAGSVCGSQVMNNSITVGVSPLPTIFNVSPTGTENGCSGGNITLDGNEVLTYNLVKNGTTVLATQVGTGIALPALSFTKPLSAGLYSVEAVYGKGCKVNMNGTLQIDNPPTDENSYSLVGNPISGRFCNDGVNAGVTLTLSNSDVGKQYSLFLGLVNVKDTISIGGALTFGTYNIGGAYSAKVASSNGCFQDMNGIVNIIAETPPSVLNLQADDNGRFCSVGGNGVGIQLVGQQSGVHYELSLAGSVVGAADGIVTNGTTLLPFKNLADNSYLFTANGTYSVTAHYLNTFSCVVNMANSVDVIPSLPPVSYIVTSAGDFCEGGFSAINVNGSENTSLYRWVNLTTTDAGAWTLGTGGLLQFLNIGIAGDYMVEAKNNFTSPCNSVMLDTVSIKMTKLPLSRNFTVKDGADCSSASLVVVENAELGVTYTIVDANSNVPTSIFFVGTTNLLDTLQIVDVNASYYLQAQRGSCPVRIAPDFLINNVGTSAVKKHVVTPIDASICNGDLGVKFGLATNSLNVKYTLYWSLDLNIDAADQKVDSIIGNGNPNVQFKKLGKKQGKYYVIGVSADKTCSNFMTNEPQLVVNPLPTAYNLTGSGLYCNPDPLDSISGAAIGLSAQQDRVMYTLQQYDALGGYIDDKVEFRGSLSGLPFAFGYFKQGSGVNTGHDTYKVVAIDTITGCTSNMDGSVLVKLASFTPVKPAVDLGSSKGQYCAGTNGVEILINSPEAGLTYQLFEQRLPADTMIVSRVSASTSSLVLGYYGIGSYYISSSWGGDACIQKSDPFTITQRVPLAFDVSYNCGTMPTDTIISKGGYISLDSSEVGISYMVMDAKNELVGFKNGTNLALTFNGLFGAGTYTVQGTCSASATPISMNNGVSISFPYDLYDLSIANRPSLTGVVGDTVLQSGSELGVNYYLRLNDWVDTFAVGTGISPPPLDFITDSVGMYHVLAIDSNNCASINTKNITILQTILQAINDSVFFVNKGLSGSVFVKQNDIFDAAGVDRNLVCRIVSYGLNSDPADVRLDSITGEFIYVKQPTFFGKDSVRYVLLNKDIPSRADTALIRIFVGNRPVEDKSFLIPNAFSPNGDGLNDYFVISSFAYSSNESQLQVFNRWGSLVYLSKGKTYDNKWDGTTNSGMISIGSDLPNGTYYYIFKVVFNVGTVLKSDEYSGFIELRR